MLNLKVGICDIFVDVYFKPTRRMCCLSHSSGISKEIYRLLNIWVKLRLSLRSISPSEREARVTKPQSQSLQKHNWDFNCIWMWGDRVAWLHDNVSLFQLVCLYFFFSTSKLNWLIRRPQPFDKVSVNQSFWSERLYLTWLALWIKWIPYRF